MVNELTPPQAWALLAHRPGEASLLDVRSTIEYEYVGHPIGAIHIPIKEAPHWQLDPVFVKRVYRVLEDKKERASDIKSHPLLVICRSGKRSLLAAQLLMNDGFKEVYNVTEGFEGDRNEKGRRNTINGWRFHNLPWEQS